MISSGLLSAVSSRGQLLGLEIGLVCRVPRKRFRSKVLQEGSSLGRIRRGVKGLCLWYGKETEILSCGQDIALSKPVTFC